jgi:transcriptional regulator with XRE-family HTH domain
MGASTAFSGAETSELGIGALLARLREELGRTQQQIADAYNELERNEIPSVTGKEIGRYERESRVPSARTRGILAQIFDLDPVLLDRAAAVSKRRRAEKRRESTEVAVATSPAVAVPLSRWALAADAAESARFARFIVSTNSDETTVEQLDADVARLARHFVSRPLAELYAEIRRTRAAAFELLRGRQRPRQTSDLLVTASRLCGLAAHVCLDLGDYDSAATHARTAWSCAEAAGHNEMRAWVRAVESLIAFWNGSPRRAADLARQGQRYSAPGSVGVRLASLEGRALAVAGDVRGATAALVTAERAREAMRGADAMPGIFSFPTAKQLTYVGTTRLAMGGPRNVQRAIECAGTAVDLYRRTRADDRSTFDLLAAHLDLARGHMLAGNTEAAEALLGTVLGSSTGGLSASILTRLNGLAGELGCAQYRGSPRVAQLRERILDTTNACGASCRRLSEPPA